ncbi:class I SAM-dependent methyltransferase [uncultured Desulfosarcina sp.]|uniref:class I SAM-dependent methyltransferase n=1 Tax=uncultured Desulfosarcina sp. TaxID=218289 RepID=UPI0029C7E478|nr:class I SAM-dependent methyltransferase [uncultured Desulfosarcina sp.]
MPKRIPHTDFEVITGTKTTRDYLAMQKKLGKFYFKGFFSKLDKLDKGKRFLEVGPGPGYQSALVAEKYRPDEIIGLEYSEDMIRVAESYVQENKLGEVVKFKNGPVEDRERIAGLGKFDFVYSTFSLHHWTDPVAGIKNLYDALNPGGTFFIYDFFRGGLFYYLKIKRGIWESIRAAYTPDEIKQMMAGLGIDTYRIDMKYPYMAITIQK